MHKPCLSAQLHPLQRAQRPLSAPAPGRKGQGAASACEPRPPQWHKTRPSTNPRGSGEQREGRATIAPAQPQHPQPQAPCVPFCWAVSLQIMHLASWPQTQGKRGQEEGASTACFPSVPPRNFFCAEQGLVHSSVEQLLHCCAEPAAAASAGTGVVLAESLCPGARVAPGRGS